MRQLSGSGQYAIKRTTEQRSTAYTNTKSFARLSQHAAPRLHVRRPKTSFASQLGPSHSDFLGVSCPLFEKQQGRKPEPPKDDICDFSSVDLLSKNSRCVGVAWRQTQTTTQANQLAALRQEAKKRRHQAFLEDLNPQAFYDLSLDIKLAQNFDFDMTSVRTNHQLPIKSALDQFRQQLLL